MSIAPHKQARPKVIGPCFYCGGFWPFGSFLPLQREKQYPFVQPWVSSAVDNLVFSETCEVSLSAHSADKCNAESYASKECVN